MFALAAHPEFVAAAAAAARPRSSSPSCDQPEILRREEPVVNGVNDPLQLRRIAFENRHPRAVGKRMHGTRFVHCEAMLAREQHERGGMARREMRRIAPELRG